MCHQIHPTEKNDNLYHNGISSNLLSIRKIYSNGGDNLRHILEVSTFLPWLGYFSLLAIEQEFVKNSPLIPFLTFFLN